MKILFSHVNFPAQFRRLLPYIVSLGHDIIFLCRKYEWHAQKIDGVRVIQYETSRPADLLYCHPYLRRFESATLEGQAVFRVASSLQQESWVPDVVVSHVGFGNGFYLKDAFPSALRVGFVEWFYNLNNSDVDFLPDKRPTIDHSLRLRTWNAETLLEISSLDKIITPTFWQKSQFPSILSDSIQVLHEGVDFNYLKNLKLSSKAVKSALLPNHPGAEVLTYVSRCFEEYRGFPQAARTISELLNSRPNLHVFMVGQDCTAYGNPRPDGKAWSEWALQTFNFPAERVHWVGSVSESQYHQILSISDVHLYLTVPFVLSWSLLEVMSVGIPVVASNTPPVQEAITNMESGLLVDFFDIEAQVAALTKLLDDKSLSNMLASSAQKAAEAYSCQASLDRWASVLGL